MRENTKRDNQALASHLLLNRVSIYERDKLKQTFGKSYLNDFWCLSHMATLPEPIIQADICRVLRISPAQALKITNRLMEKGYIDRYDIFRPACFHGQVLERHHYAYKINDTGRKIIQKAIAGTW
jgi:hypothetical protein